MANANTTKKAFAEALKSLLQTESFEQLRVGDICALSGRNRKSFYYHFQDKYDLVCWIFDSELVASLRVAVLKYDMSFQEVALRVYNYFYDNRTLYRKFLQVKGQNSFREHFGSMASGFLYELLGFPVNDGELQRFCINFYTDAILQSLEKWLAEPHPISPEEYLSRLSMSLNCFTRSVDKPSQWEQG